MKIKTNAALAAQQIKTILKEAFPSVKFSVKSENGGTCDAVRVSWVDGPVNESVYEKIKKFAYGRFECLDDSYRTDNNIEGLPQAKYIMTNHTISEKAYEVLFDYCKKWCSGWNENLTSLNEKSQWLQDTWSAWTAREYIERKISFSQLFIDPSNFDESKITDNFI